MKYLIFSTYALFFTNFILGCQHDFEDIPPAIEFYEYPISHPNILDDEDWIFPPNSDSSGQTSPLGVGGESSLFNICHEVVTVDFEPSPFGNLVQTVPYHLEKEPIQDAFISVKMQTQQIPWIIYFQSQEVKFAHQPLIAFDDYGGDLNCYLSIDQSICEVHLWDTVQAHNYLHTYEQLIAEIEIECYIE